MLRLILALAVLLAFWPSPAAQAKSKSKGRSPAAGQGKSNGRKQSKDYARQRSRRGSSDFGGDLHVRLGKDRDLIRRYVGDYKGGKGGGAAPWSG